ncbi:hypothetical protein EXM25_02395 [Mycobacteroides abscessus subsp. massiliense]|uniref:hypothetical protein n=1 Tax=Mycobacteroides abscessus TaxID=36809 RepID=UPI001022A54B|nr:hypothetical protein [Mycobacteroides abscessus]QBE76000.1 hypothetical protein EXM25_00290 [Mycobacteroides abscessus subsp. massiliense]QBE76372.1 hypothetical protein EXM25_02395 [Mycobacteroides abscessus subsp. massiliense]QBE80730.1 hypothetical protein EXM27_00290 [Mycobacteroides abscessus subsp. massiliense]QBE81102.1 hypothetical protein EXM27_02390 [Mycobacteroides abscessus subsp. massiliense]
MRRWTHTIPGILQEDKTYDRWPLEPGMQAQIHGQQGDLATEIHIEASDSIHIMSATPER